MKTRQEETFSLVRLALIQVLETTFNEAPEILPQGSSAAEPNTQIIASMGLSGSLSASLAVGLSEAGACLLVSKMIGLEIKTFNQDVVDGIGELANIIAGVVKTSFSELGCVFILSLPTVITASVNLSLRQLLKSEGVMLSAKILGVIMDVFFFYSRPSIGLVTLADVISKGLSSQDATEALIKLLAQKPKI